MFTEEVSRATVYGAWQLRQDKRGTVTDHVEEGMNIPVLRNDCEAVLVIKQANLGRDVKVGRRPND